MRGKWAGYAKINDLQLNANKKHYTERFKNGNNKQDFNALKNKDSINILDIGSGNGQNTINYLKLLIETYGYKNINVTMLDPSPEMQEKAEELCSNAEFSSCNVKFTYIEKSAEKFFSEKTTEKYDMVFSFFVFQWLEKKTQEVILKLEMLSKDGIFINYYPSQQTKLDKERHELLTDQKSAFYIQNYKDGLNFAPPSVPKENAIEIKEKELTKAYKGENAKKEFADFVDVVMPECDPLKKGSTLKTAELIRDYVVELAARMADTLGNILFKISMTSMFSTASMRKKPVKSADLLLSQGTFKQGKTTSSHTQLSLEDANITIENK